MVAKRSLYEGTLSKSGHLLKSVYQLSIGALYQFTSGSDTWVCTNSGKRMNLWLSPKRGACQMYRLAL